MQIACISIYSKSGERRDVEFRLGALNIITGDSKTGKSSLLTIVDYCLGRSRSSIPHTDWFQSISWYAVLLQFEDGSRAIVARQSPTPERSNSRAMLEFGGPSLRMPPVDRLVINTDVDSMRTQLGARIGLGDVVIDPSEDALRPPFSVGLGGAVPFTLQEQHEIDSKVALFHRQDDPGVAQGLRDSLPFFLGAVDGQQASRREQLRAARQELRRLDAAVAASVRELSGRDDELRTLFEEARSVGLVAEGQPQSSDDMVAALNAVRFERVSRFVANEVDITTQDDRRALEASRRTLAQELTTLLRDRDLLLDEREGEGGYRDSLAMQVERLGALDLLQAQPDSAAWCPVCNQALQSADPTPTQLTARLTELRDALSGAERLKPRHQRALSRLDTRIAQVRSELTIAEGALSSRGSLDVAADAGALGATQDFVRGRVDAILSRIRAFDTEGLRVLKAQRDTAQAAVRALEAELDDGVVREQLTSRLNALSVYLGEYASELNLEQADRPIRLDVERMTIVVDTETGPLPLVNIGSGENWVGYHLATHLAMHRYFVNQLRPVPRFLMVDQPSKAHFQSDRPASETDYVDRDREAVRNIFRLFAAYAEAMGERFQLVVVDHASYDDSWFTDAVIYNWRGSEKLIPEAWLTTHTGEPFASE